MADHRFSRRGIILVLQHFPRTENMTPGSTQNGSGKEEIVSCVCCFDLILTHLCILLLVGHTPLSSHLFLNSDLPFVNICVRICILINMHIMLVPIKEDTGRRERRTGLWWNLERRRSAALPCSELYLQILFPICAHCDISTSYFHRVPNCISTNKLCFCKYIWNIVHQWNICIKPTSLKTWA